MLFVPRTLSSVLEMVAAPSTASPVCSAPRLHPPQLFPSTGGYSLLSMHVAAALLAKSSAGQWVGFSLACLSNFLSPHCTSSQQFPHIQRWAVPNLHYLCMRNSKGFISLYVMSAVGIPSATLLPAQVAACFWQIVGNCILGKKILGRLMK